MSGRAGRDNPKSSGESSDTESAVGRVGAGAGVGAGARLAEFSARVRAALPRRDKVQAAEPRPDDDKPTEEKKGVVYAELALGEQPAARPPPAATEYAEIVYTDQGKDAKE